MALGKVASIDGTSRTSGTVLEDETGQTYPFRDQNFPNTGLAVGSPCTYDIDYVQNSPIASNLQSYVPTERDITSPVSGPISINPGETITIKNSGSVTGAIAVDSGILIVEGTVSGDVTVENQGNCVVRKGGVIKGTVIINSASAFKVVNKGVIKGTVIINSANRFIVGNDAGGGSITGEITIVKIRKVTITASSTINCGA